MPFTPGNPFDTTSGLEVITSNIEALSAQIVDVQYPEFLWPNIVPQASIDTNINPGAAFASYLVRDQRGKGKFMAKGSSLVPTVGMTIDKVSVGLEWSAIGATFTRQDQRQYSMGFNASLLTDYVNIMKKGSERHKEGVIFYGDAELDYPAYLDYPGVPIVQAALNAATTSRAWKDKTADEILLDINDAITSIWVNSKQIHLPGVIQLPAEQYALLVARKSGQIGDVNQTILKFVSENNIYTSRTGTKLTFVPIRYLDTAGAAGVSRMRVVTFEEMNYFMPLPLDIQLLAPQLVELGTRLLADYIFGPVHIKYPFSQLSVDGI